MYRAGQQFKGVKSFMKAFQSAQGSLWAKERMRSLNNARDELLTEAFYDGSAPHYLQNMKRPLTVSLLANEKPSFCRQSSASCTLVKAHSH